MVVFGELECVYRLIIMDCFHLVLHTNDTHFVSDEKCYKINSIDIDNKY